MFVTLFAWAQGPTANYVEAGENTVAGLMTLGVALVFAGWLLYVGVREYLRMRREDRPAQPIDIRTIPADGLGPTMADGGEPIAPNPRKGRRERIG
jgi:hypothetical protein